MDGKVPALESSAAPTADNLSHVTLLLPVWGSQYTRRFLEFCLPTLLAPNNIPALARALPCRFVLLADKNDEATVRAHPAWQRLMQICAVEIAFIDDLITGHNHSATITLAFERAVRQTASPTRNTCFIFLMSDYLVADGSLASVLTAVRNGARGVLVGNFQIVAEEAGPLFEKCFRLSSAEIIPRPRDLVKFSLRHLHPATIANMVNCGLIHNAHCNRLFWQVDENTVVGRFYLMHPIAIRPEVDDFTVGSSWDYSFIPELCPSGNVVTLTDSDAYLVVEVQPRDYEHEHLRPGPFDTRGLAESLSEWTTARHRLNVQQKLIFHAGELPAGLPAVIAQSDKFVSDVANSISDPPVSHRQHPYWLGSYAAHQRDTRGLLNKQDLAVALEQVTLTGPVRAPLARLGRRLLGSAPGFTRLHPLWPDYCRAASAIGKSLEENGRVLLIADDPESFARWLLKRDEDILAIRPTNALRLSQTAYSSLRRTFDSILMVIREDSVDLCDSLISFAGPLLKPNRTCSLLFVNARPRTAAAEFAISFARGAAGLWHPGPSILEIQYTECTPFRWFVRDSLGTVLRRAMIGSRIMLAFAVLAACPLLLAAYVANRAVRFSSRPPKGASSSIFVVVRPLQTSADLPLFGGEGIQSSAEASLPSAAVNG